MKRALALGSLLCLIITALVLARGVALSSAHAGPPPDLRTYDPLVPSPRRLAAVPGQIIVKFKPGLAPGARAEIVQPYGGALAQRLPVADYYLVTVKEISRDTVPQTITSLNKSPYVESAEPNYYRYADGAPNDPYYAYQWHLAKIQMPTAWDLTAGSGITVAVVDTGIAYEDYAQYKKAPDLANTTFVPGWNFVNSTSHANDDNSHGTHVAGTIAQSTNNNLGVAGVAYQARLMPLKALNANGAGQDDWVASAIVWAADSGAKVINLSLGAESPAGILEDAVNYAYGKGVVVVAAAGNSGVGSLSYPAAYPNVIAVGAVRYDEARSPYSNYGTGLAVMAPGGDLGVDQNNDSYPDGVLQQTFDPNSHDPAAFGYWFFQGTSMATPHVSGVAALLMARGVATTPDTVRQVLQASAKDLGSPGWDPQYGYGLVQARSALDWLPPATGTATRTPTQTGTPTSTPSPTPTGSKTATPTATPTLASPLTITGVRFLPVSLSSGDLLQVDIGVRNDSTGLALTQGPNPGFIYNEGDSVDSRGYPDINGRWRVGVEYGARVGGKDHPYRWGLGADLAAGNSITVTGYIRLNTVRSTSYWAGLVQELWRWWQDNLGMTTITVGSPPTEFDLRITGGFVTRYANIFQCTQDGTRQKVWSVGFSGTTATYQYTRPLPAGHSCGSINPTFGEYQLTISAGTMTPGAWATQCLPSGGVRRVWRAAGNGRDVPFVYPELAASCPI